MELRIGVVGMGGFAVFACQNFVQVPGVSVAGYAESATDPQKRADERFGLGEPLRFDELVRSDLVDLVYIATPPSFHFEQALAALNGGKHVIVEKPLSLSLEQAKQLVETARRSHLACVANQMQLYNPIVAQVKALIDRKLIGEPLYARFDNFATDEGLSPEHWFWNRQLSGGIFLEHGVHFFDLFSHWFGEGEVLFASRKLRPGSNLEEQVECMARYGEVDAHFLHSFTQASRMDRQEFRILFERGDLIMEEWVPTRFRLDALVDDSQAKALTEVFSGATLDITTMYGGKDRKFSARHRKHAVTQRVLLHGGERVEKMHVYGRLLRSMIADQMAWIANPKNRRLLDEENGLRAVAMAEDANRIAIEGS